MTITIGLDIGTTTITALALDTASGAVVARATTRNDAEMTSAADRARGRSEWDAVHILERALAALCDVAAGLGERRREVVGLALTGQQHGGLVVDPQLHALTPLIGWQDRRGEAAFPDGTTYIEHARALLGEDAPLRTGCTLGLGFLGTTLLWLNRTGALPADGQAVFITDLVAARLTDTRPITDPTMAGSSGLLNLLRRDWDHAAIAALGLPLALFSEVREAGEPLGGLSQSAAEATGLRQGFPVFVGLGDNQASFVGSVADCQTTVVVNVGTGAQVGRYVEQVYHAPPLETRPYPRGGYLLVNAGLAGGRVYALLDRFFRQVGLDVLGGSGETAVYATLNRLAAGVPPGADGLRCEPYFMGSRADPTRRAVWSGMTDRNFTPAHMTRALLEGMARSYREGYDLLEATTGLRYTRLVGAGNGLRENPVLLGMAAAQFGATVAVPAHREEAAYGAALVAGVGAGVWPSLEATGSIIQYEIRA